LALAILVYPLSAQQSFAVRQQRGLWPDKTGQLHAEEAGLRFVAPVKKGDPMPLFFGWDDIQQLTLSERAVGIVTYQDRLWQFGRDRHFHFALTGEIGDTGGFAALEAPLAAALGQRLVRALAGTPESVLWEIPAKRSGLPRGAEGRLSFNGEELRFDSEKPGQSRRWLLATIQTIASTGPLALTVVAPERALSDQGGQRSFQFQLKQPLSADRYRQLWQGIEAARGLRLRFQDNP